MVDISKKTEKIRSMFDLIASRYDLANHLLSFGVDRYWRRIAVEMSAVKDGERLLDMCCGTGDLSFTFAKQAAGLSEITGADFSGDMLQIAQKKQQNRDFGDIEFDWLETDCTKTTIPAESFDIVSCGFGVRNMADLNAGLCEMRRLLADGGRACILEFSLPKAKLIRWAYLLYFSYILPILGGLIAGKFSAYKYLAGSVRKWDSEVNLSDELKRAGFSHVDSRRLTFGLVTCYLAAK